MYRYLTCCAVLWCLAGVSTADGQSTVSAEGGVRAVALGGAATALTGDVWGFSNPASWATLPGRALSFFASQSFGLSQLQLGAVQYVEITPLGAVAGGARTFGYEEYRGSHFNLGFARGFTLGTSRRFYAGFNLRYYHVRLGGGYGSSGAVGLSLGGLVQIFPRLHLGFHATNLNGPAWTRGEALPQTLSLGLSYAPGPRILLLLDGFKDLDRPLSVRAGLEMRPVDVLALRIGITTRPTRFTAGVGLRLGRLRAGIAAERHAALGWSPAASLGFAW